jgi:inward rectifier potassium channel
MARLPKIRRIPPPDPNRQVALSESDRYFTDFYHHLLTSSWPMLFAQIVGAFITINFVFAIAYYFSGGIENAHSFADVYFFSVETIATIGYGKMSPVTITSEILMSIEALLGLINFAVITGLIFAKFSRPTARVRFSRVAVISKRDGVPSLMFRMANVRSNKIVEAQIHVVFARDELTREGEHVRRFHDLDLVRYRNAIFAYSWTAVHPIQPGSPFYGVKPEDLATDNASLTVSLTGIDETFSQTIHSRGSYNYSDIIWGARLADIIVLAPGGGFTIDYSKFDEVELSYMPIGNLESA